MSDDELKISLDSSDVDESVDKTERKVLKTIDAVEKLDRQLRKKSPEKIIKVDIKKEDVKKVANLHRDIKNIPDKKTVEIEVKIDKKNLRKISGIQKTLKNIDQQSRDQEKAVKSLKQDSEAVKYAGVTDGLASKAGLTRIEAENRAYARQAVKIEQINRLLLQQQLIEGKISKERAKELQRIANINRREDARSVFPPVITPRAKTYKPDKVDFDKSLGIVGIDSDGSTITNSQSYLKKWGNINEAFGVGNSKIVTANRQQASIDYPTSLVAKSLKKEFEQISKNLGLTPGPMGIRGASSEAVNRDLEKAIEKLATELRPEDESFPARLEQSRKDMQRGIAKFDERRGMAGTLTDFEMKEYNALVKLEKTLEIFAGKNLTDRHSPSEKILQRATDDLYKKKSFEPIKIIEGSKPYDKHDLSNIIKGTNADQQKGIEIVGKKFTGDFKDLQKEYRDSLLPLEQRNQKIIDKDLDFPKENIVIKTVEKDRPIEKNWNSLSRAEKDQRFMDGTSPEGYRKGEVRGPDYIKNKDGKISKTYGSMTDIDDAVARLPELNKEFKAIKSLSKDYISGDNWGENIESKIESYGKFVKFMSSSSDKLTEKRKKIEEYKTERLGLSKEDDWGSGANMEKKIKDYEKFVNFMAASSGKISRSQQQVNKYRDEQLAQLDDVIKKEKEAGRLVFKFEEDKFRKEWNAETDKSLVDQEKYLTNSIAANKTLQKSFLDQTKNIENEAKLHNKFITDLEKIQKGYADVYSKKYLEKIDGGKSKERGANALRKDYAAVEKEITALKESKKVLDDKVKTSKKYFDLVEKTGIEYNRIRHLEEKRPELLAAMGGDHKKADDALYDNSDQKDAKYGRSFGIGRIDAPRRSVGFGRSGGRDDVIQQLPQNKLLGRFAQFGMMASGLAATIFVTQMIGAQLYNLMEIIINWENAILGVIDNIKLSSDEMEELPGTIREYSRNLGINQSKASAAFEASMKYNIGGSQQDVQGMYALNYSENIKDYESAALLTRLAREDSGFAGMKEQYSEKYQKYSGEGEKFGAFGFEWDKLKGAAGEGLIEIWSNEDTEYGDKIKKTMRDISDWMVQNRAIINDWADTFVAGMKAILKWTQATLPAMVTFVGMFAAWHGGKMIFTILKGVSTAIKMISVSLSSATALAAGLTAVLSTIGPAVAAIGTVTVIWKLAAAYREASKNANILKEARERLASPEKYQDMTHAEIDSAQYQTNARKEKLEKLLNKEKDWVQPSYRTNVRREKTHQERIKRLTKEIEDLSKDNTTMASQEAEKYGIKWSPTKLIHEFKEFVGILEKANEQFTFMSEELFKIETGKIQMQFEKDKEAPFKDALAIASLQKDIATHDLRLKKDPEAQVAFDKKAVIAETAAKGWDQYEKKIFRLKEVTAQYAVDLKGFEIIMAQSGPKPRLIKAYEQLQEKAKMANLEINNLTLFHVQTEFEKLTKTIDKLETQLENFGKGNLQKALDKIAATLKPNSADNPEERAKVYNLQSEIARKKNTEDFGNRTDVRASLRKQINDLNAAFTKIDIKGNITNLPKTPEYDYKMSFLQSQIKKEDVARRMRDAKTTPRSWKLQSDLKLEEALRKINLKFDQDSAVNKVLYNKLPKQAPVMNQESMAASGQLKDGKIIKVVDADTFLVQWKDETVSTVRAIGLNAYEKNTPEGLAATNLAAHEMLNKVFSFEASLGDGALGKYGRELYDIILKSGLTYTQKILSQGAGVAETYGNPTQRAGLNSRAERFAVDNKMKEHMLSGNTEILKTLNTQTAETTKTVSDKLIILNGIWKNQVGIISDLQLGGEEYLKHLQEKRRLEAQQNRPGASPEYIAHINQYADAIDGLNDLMRQKQLVLSKEDQRFFGSPGVEKINKEIRDYISKIVIKAIRNLLPGAEKFSDAELGERANRALGTGASTNYTSAEILERLDKQTAFDQETGRGFSNEQTALREAKIRINATKISDNKEDPTDYKRDAKFQLEQEKIAKTKAAWEDYYSRTSVMMEDHYKNEKAIIENSYQNNLRANSGISKSMAEVIKQEELYQLALKNRRSLTIAEDLSVGVIEGLRRLQGEYMTTGEILENSMVSGVDKLTDALHGVAMGTKSLKDAFRDMTLSVLDDIAKMLLKQIMLEALMGGNFASGKSNAIGGIFGAFGMESQMQTVPVESSFQVPFLDTKDQTASEPVFGPKNKTAPVTEESMFTGLFGKIKTGLTKTFNGLGELFQEDGILGGLFGSMKSGFSSVLGSIGGLFKEDGILGGLFGSMKDGFSSLFSGIMSSVGGGGGGWGGLLSGVMGIFMAEQGRVVSGSGISSFSNSVVSSPTLVPNSTIHAFATGGALFGEAGPEAIMPLTRMPSGDLGVQVQNNNQETSSENSEVAPANVKIVNVLDPAIVQDFMETSEGDQLIVNMIQRNANSINQLLQIGG